MHNKVGINPDQADKDKFVIKDSGKRQQFESGMQRDVSTDKILWHLVASGPLLRRWAEHLTAGAKKYDADNWMKARGHEEMARFRESAFRHFMQWYNGDRDEDHAAAVFFNINGAEYVRDQIIAKERYDMNFPPSARNMGREMLDKLKSLETSPDPSRMTAREFIDHGFNGPSGPDDEHGHLPTV